VDKISNIYDKTIKDNLRSFNQQDLENYEMRTQIINMMTRQIYLLENKKIKKTTIYAMVLRKYNKYKKENYGK
tara:strand:+ start:62 stop:280 length:219 start_codon:yes stop_codon:yes gene_type:complete